MHKFRSVHFLIVTVLIAGAIFPSQAMAMRCGTHIITRGDSQAKVLRYCGEPTQARSRFITRGARHSAFEVRRPQEGVQVRTGNRYDYYVSEEVLVEEWVFNLGPNKLMREVTFENGYVVKVDTLEYGYNE
jgi:hypothetical protein